VWWRSRPRLRRSGSTAPAVGVHGSGGGWGSRRSLQGAPSLEIAQGTGARPDAPSASPTPRLRPSLREGYAWVRAQWGRGTNGMAVCAVPVPGARAEGWRSRRERQAAFGSLRDPQRRSGLQRPEGAPSLCPRRSPEHRTSTTPSSPMLAKEKRDGHEGTHRASLWRHGGESAGAEAVTPALADPAGALCRPMYRPVPRRLQRVETPGRASGHP